MRIDKTHASEWLNKFRRSLHYSDGLTSLLRSGLIIREEIILHDLLLDTLE